MTDYDFRVLQPSEFECISRDLLQARENIFIESFADGRDKGIDFRFAYNNDKTCIIQCKRYKEWNELKTHLKKEVNKVKRLNPQRYILTTSVDLTENQKDTILVMFSPFILNFADILGRKDLNNLLALYSEIENNYHKLWLASTNVLNQIINKDIVNWSAFELEKIEREIRIYVENESLNKALTILKENHYVVISGIPGIGKTTLSYMLVYMLLSQDFDEFVYVTNDMDNAAKMLEKEKRQVFFFDDFLGKTSFVQQPVSFENKLVSFIDKVKNSKNTLFILATREYVLSEALAQYEMLAASNINLAKCVIQMEYYTKTIKARILYNHLAEANIPAEYINAFLDEHSYRELIEHKNFSPRVIQAIIKRQIWKDILPNDFAVKVKEFFDNPISVWEFAFDNLDVSTRYALLVLVTMGDRVMLDDFQEAYRTFCTLTYKEIGLTYDDVKWRRTLKVLMNCFIKTESRYGLLLVSMHNPSIADFVVFYLNHNHYTLTQLVAGACFIEQLYFVFTDEQERAGNDRGFIRESDFPLLYDSFNRIWNQGKTCQLNFGNWNGIEKEFFWGTRVLFDFMTKFPNFCNHYDGFVENMYNTEELTCGTIRMKYRAGLMVLLDWTKLNAKADEWLCQILDNETLNTDEWIELAEAINKLGLVKEIMNHYYYEMLDDNLYEDIRELSDLYDCNELNKKIDKLREYFPDWHWYSISTSLDDAEERLKKEKEENDDTYSADISFDSWKTQKEKEDSQIDEMFSSLRVFD